MRLKNKPTNLRESRTLAMPHNPSIRHGKRSWLLSTLFLGPTAYTLAQLLKSVVELSSYLTTGTVGSHQV